MLWKDWGLRTWLNGTFLNSAFNYNEALHIASRNLIDYDKGVTDKISLLYYNDLYEIDDIQGVYDCIATNYAVSRGLSKSKETNKYTYWLMPDEQGVLHFVRDNDGSSRYYLDGAPAAGHGVRPCMTIQYR